MTSRTPRTILLCCLVSLPAFASVGTVFDNFPPDGSINAYSINSGWEVSDSFTLSSPATIGGINIALWNDPPDDPDGTTVVSLGWSIGSVAFGTDLASATARLTELTGVTFAESEAGQNDLSRYNIAAYNFTLPIALILDAGTYYLTLSNAVASDGGAPTDFVYWDVNNDPNHLGITGSQYDGSHTGPVSGAESFQLLSTPEPASFFLLGSGLLLAAALRRKTVRGDSRTAAPLGLAFRNLAYQDF